MINTGNARINSRPLRWLTDKMASLQADDSDMTHENSEPRSRRRENPTDHGTATSYPYRVTEAADIIPKVNGLSFVNDYPRVMRFHAGHQSLWTTQRTAESEMDEVRSLEQSADASADGKKCHDVETATGRSSLQGVVAGASFVGGLAVSMTLCLLCYRIRRRTTRRTFDQKRLSESSIVGTVLDSEEVGLKTEP